MEQIKGGNWLHHLVGSAAAVGGLRARMSLMTLLSMLIANFPEDSVTKKLRKTACECWVSVPLRV